MDVFLGFFCTVLWLQNGQVEKKVERKPLISEEVNWMFPKIGGISPQIIH